jgi:hypothetical protein
MIKIFFLPSPLMGEGKGGGGVGNLTPSLPLGGIPYSLFYAKQSGT